MVEIIEWDKGDSIRIGNIFTDIDDANYDPGTIELKIYDPKGSLDTTVTFAAGEIVQSAEGIYYYDYDIAADAIIGSWISKWTAVTSGFADVSKDQFKVGESEEKLYCTVNEVWNKIGVDENVATRDEILPLIKDSMAEIDAMMGKSFKYNTEKIQWFDTNRNDPGVNVISVYLNYTPIISITSLEEYDMSNNLIKSYDADEYWVNLDTGRITLLDDEFVKSIHRVKVVYNYGAIQIPHNISTLCCIFSAIRVLEHQVGNLYDDPTSYSTCGISVSVGEPYVSASRLIEFLRKDAEKLIASIGRLKPSCFIL